MSPDDQFHVGMVTDDVASTMTLLAQTLGYEWGPVVTNDVQVRLPDGEHVIEMTCVYSRTEPRIELVGSVPGTHWVPADAGAHHLGYWSDDVAGDSAALSALGFVEEADAGRWSYLRHPSGLRIELVDRAMAASMAVLWT